MRDLIRQQWLDLRDRLNAQADTFSSLSLRLPGQSCMWFGRMSDLAPERIEWQASLPMPDSRTHAAVYQTRADVGAVLLGGGVFTRHLADFGGVMPILFDEQARHIGHMGSPVTSESELPFALSRGGNAILFRDMPMTLGTTGARMAMNVELFEKCAKAYTLAKACGAELTLLPWWVVFVANGRLMKDEKRAAHCFAEGKVPPENRGY